jgi:hypothetical protein
MATEYTVEGVAGDEGFAHAARIAGVLNEALAGAVVPSGVDSNSDRFRVRAFPASEWASSRAPELARLLRYVARSRRLLGPCLVRAGGARVLHCGEPDEGVGRGPWEHEGDWRGTLPEGGPEETGPEGAREGFVGGRRAVCRMVCGWLGVWRTRVAGAGGGSVAVRRASGHEADARVSRWRPMNDVAVA